MSSRLMITRSEMFWDITVVRRASNSGRPDKRLRIIRYHDIYMFRFIYWSFYSRWMKNSRTSRCKWWREKSFLVFVGIFHIGLISSEHASEVYKRRILTQLVHIGSRYYLNANLANGRTNWPLHIESGPDFSPCIWIARFASWRTNEKIAKFEVDIFAIVMMEYYLSRIKTCVSYECLFFFSPSISRSV